MKNFAMVVGAVVVLLGLATCGYVGGWFTEGAAVLQEEVGPRAVLRKYEWFKNALAQLDAKKANIGVYASKAKSMEDDYEGTPRKDWDRVDKQTLSQWHAEVAGVKASYNSLAAEYNAAMAKVNWKFTNAGDVPGGGEPLPREVRAYVSE